MMAEIFAPECGAPPGLVAGGWATPGLRPELLSGCPFGANFAKL